MSTVPPDDRYRRITIVRRAAIRKEYCHGLLRDRMHHGFKYGALDVKVLCEGSEFQSYVWQYVVSSLYILCTSYYNVPYNVLR